MGSNDQVAVVSTSGLIGFLQQLTDNQTVLRSAIGRLGNKRNPETYAGTTRISEYMASQIENGHDRRLFAYLMESVKLEYGMGLGALRGDHRNDSAGQANPTSRQRVVRSDPSSSRQQPHTKSHIAAAWRFVQVLSSSRQPHTKSHIAAAC
jgi:hypothetical protein